ncbi:MAG: hypothetical protein HZB75_01815 [Candidatus Saccharibacteria bacterium]|nr:MAG: hypothetical protein HZB75_01815 [Candidatus Saccharibacteria bacterium]
MPSPAVIREILADPAFHANLNARAAALKEGTRPEDLQQNTDAAAIVAQADAAATARDEKKGFLAETRTKLALSRLLVAYVNTYFPDL